MYMPMVQAELCMLTIQPPVPFTTLQPIPIVITSNLHDPYIYSTTESYY